MSALLRFLFDFSRANTCDRSLFCFPPTLYTTISPLIEYVSVVVANQSTPLQHTPPEIYFLKHVMHAVNNSNEINFTAPCFQ